MMSKRIPPGLCGEPTEATITINGLETKALIDTGSTVSTISKKFYLDHLQDIPIQEIGSLLHIECADGKHLPYEGYVTTEIQIQDVDEPVTSILLVIPDSTYNLKIPILLGTYVLNILMDSLHRKYGDSYLDKSKLKTPWYLFFRSMIVREQEIRKYKFRQGNTELRTIQV